MSVLNRLAHLDRREMLAAGTLAAAQGLSAARPISSADSIRLAVLGSGGRARHLMRSVVKVPGLELVALADVREDQVTTTRGHLRDIAPAKAEIQAVKDFRAVLDR